MLQLPYLRLLAGVSLLGVVACSSGGGGDDDSPSTNHAPLVFNYSISTSVPSIALPNNIRQVNAGDGGGGIMAVGSIQFQDDDSNVTTLRIVEGVMSPTGEPSEPVIQEEDIRTEWYGKSSGTIQFSRVVDTMLSGGKVWVVSVRDEHGAQSNTVGGGVVVIRR